MVVVLVDGCQGLENPRWRALECSSNYGEKLTSARGSSRLIMKTFNLSSSVIQHEIHSASRPGDSVFHCLSTFSIIRARCDAQRQGSFRGNRKKKKSEALEWELTERQVSSWVHNTPFLLRGLLVVINETSSSGPGTMPILVRIGRSFGPGAQSFPLQVVKDFGQGPSSSFVAGWATPGIATSTSPHPEGLAPHPFLAVCVLDISGIMSRLLFPPCALH